MGLADKEKTELSVFRRERQGFGRPGASGQDDLEEKVTLSLASLGAALCPPIRGWFSTDQ